MSGLTPNPDKRKIFMCGVDESVKCQLLASLGYKEGTLPVRYLGVPLISSRLKKVDCSILVDKIVGRVKSWTCKALSYAGRLQLGNSILFFYPGLLVFSLRSSYGGYQASGTDSQILFMEGIGAQKLWG
ncbi:hypothetical protein SLA2020_380770 [Shorea laevis]|jgi:hypothetical protein